MEFMTFIRKPFTVEAIEITEENMKEVATLIGTVRTKDGVTYISLDRRIVPNVHRAFVGWYLTRLEDNYRVYAPKLFASEFVEQARFGNYTQTDLDAMFEEPDPAPPHGIDRPVV
jgi:hypothetical protein